MKAFEVYRFTHADGTAKDWGYSDLANGEAEIRWGRQDHLVHRQQRPAAVARQRARAKLRAGYRYLGHFALNERGSRSPLPPAKPRVDLSALLGHTPGFYF